MLESRVISAAFGTDFDAMIKLYEIALERLWWKSHAFLPVIDVCLGWSGTDKACDVPAPVKWLLAWPLTIGASARHSGCSQ